MIPLVIEKLYLEHVLFVNLHQLTPNCSQLYHLKSPQNLSILRIFKLIS